MNRFRVSVSYRLGVEFHTLESVIEDPGILVLGVGTDVVKRGRGNLYSIEISTLFQKEEWRNI